MNRRDFLRSMTVTVGGLTVAQTLLTPVMALAQGKAGGSLPLITPKDPVAKAVGYIEDFKKAPKAKGNNCANCAFYAKTDVRSGKEVGTCLIFAGKVVYAEAYCNSWAKKV